MFCGGKPTESDIIVSTGKQMESHLLLPRSHRLNKKKMANDYDSSAEFQRTRGQKLIGFTAAMRSRAAVDTE